MALADRVLRLEGPAGRDQGHRHGDAAARGRHAAAGALLRLYRAHPGYCWMSLAGLTPRVTLVVAIELLQPQRPHSTSSPPAASSPGRPTTSWRPGAGWMSGSTCTWCEASRA